MTTGGITVGGATGQRIDSTGGTIIAIGWAALGWVAGLARFDRAIPTAFGAVAVVDRIAAGRATLVVITAARDQFVATRGIAIGNAADGRINRT